MAACAAVGADSFGARWLPDARTPAARIAAVVSFRRRWVIQLGERVAIQARIPVAAAPAVIALAMHCMHMRSG